jgi:hypothetical protein
MLALGAGACTSSEHFRMRIQIPRKAEVKLADFDGIVLTDFWLKSESEEFDLKQEIQDYFRNELAVELRQEVELNSASLPDESVFKDQEFWKNISSDQKKSLIITGTAEFSQETRKALISREKKRFEEPFPARKNLETRKFFSLNMHIHLLDSETGSAVYDREFKESRAYTNPNQTAHFAFFDLAYEIKEKLLREILGGERIQERYLIIR